ncbi:OmpA family protein [Nonomuraea endophytica]|uniref:Outer membrane protein OmpA-like peptidoglycan-associated protein n=1 Tax=Nonomuraea endophytica TaxID=714136 RepID=A0A7W8A541_9ACTN|nr:OmpA family protein [Nonomuraea endophytica]MBB5078891.1 outer membrane protein OmpA-like peptidoglycan-associated protein [Nonomuraea endophytica]
MSNRILALAAVMTLAATGCGMLPQQRQAAPATTAPAAPTTPAATTPAATPTATQDDRPALAETRSTMTPDLKLEVVGLNRVKGKHLVVQIRLTNTGDGKDLPWTGQMGDHTRKLGEIKWASGIGVLDERARTWILPYKPESSPCLCTDQKRDGVGYFIDPGASITVYAVLPAPSGNPETATVVTPVAAPMLNVPISDEPPQGDFPDPDAEPVTPVTRRIVLPSESADRTEETSDDGKDLQVNLSADVLFAVDKAVLTPRAKAVLARTAKLIDASPSTQVKVEGHADSSGTDAINDPLSARRAQAVRAAIAPLLSRDGVAFQTKGYGSRRPLYSNDTDEGKRRNRRVTVTFAKPEPASAQPSPSEDVVSTVGPDADLTGSAKADGQPIAMEITGLRRLPGGLGLLTYTVANEGTAEAWFNDLHNGQDWQSYKYQAASAVVLTDQANRRRYLPGRLQVPTGDEAGSYCACTDVSGVRLSTEKFGPGQKREFWGLFALPDSASALSVKIAGFRELQVPIQ